MQTAGQCTVRDRNKAAMPCRKDDEKGLRCELADITPRKEASHRAP